MAVVAIYRFLSTPLGLAPLPYNFLTTGLLLPQGLAKSIAHGLLLTFFCQFCRPTSSISSFVRCLLRRYPSPLLIFFGDGRLFSLLRANHTRKMTAKDILLWHLRCGQQFVCQTSGENFYGDVWSSHLTFVGTQLFGNKTNGGLSMCGMSYLWHGKFRLLAKQPLSCGHDKLYVLNHIKM